MSLFGRQPIEGQRPIFVLRQTLAEEVHVAEVELGLGVAQFCGGQV